MSREYMIIARLFLLETVLEIFHGHFIIFSEQYKIIQTIKYKINYSNLFNLASQRYTTMGNVIYNTG
jgi:hypothetical protein